MGRTDTEIVNVKCPILNRGNVRGQTIEVLIEFEKTEIGTREPKRIMCDEYLAKLCDCNLLGDGDGCIYAKWEELH